MSARSRLLGLVLLMAVVLVLAFTGFLRQLVVVPLYQLVLVLRQLYESIPQRLVWSCLVLLSGVLIWRIVLSGTVVRRRRPAAQPARVGAVNDWLTLIRNEQGPVNANGQLAQELRTLVLAAVVEEQVAEKRQRRRLEDPALNIPQDVLLYLQGRSQPEQQRAPWRGNNRSPAASPLPRLVEYLEDTLNQRKGNSR